MSSAELLSYITGVSPSKFSRYEILILEAELFSRLCEELKKTFREHYKEFFHLMKFSQQKEEDMLEDYFARCVVNDILASEEYTLSGIACYTQMPEDVVYDVATGLNTSPSAKFLRKIIELHRTVRKDLYYEIMKKITNVHELAS